MTAVRSQPGANHLEVVGGDSPVDAAVPFWITACVRLQPPQRRNGSTVDSAADKVLTAVQVLIADRIKAAKDAAVVLDRTKVARWCGYDSPKKAGWIFEYLASIEFLVIEQQYVRGRRGRAADTFTVFTQPPVGYVGPRTYAELDRALADPNFPPTLFMVMPQTRRSGSWNPGGHQDQDLGSQMGTKTDKHAGQGLGTQVGTKTTDLGSQMGTKTDKHAGQGLGTQVGTFLQIDRSSISEREIEGSIEPVPGGAAKPPATGQDKRLLAEVRRLVRRLPWGPWAERQNVGYSLNERDIKLVTEPIYAAIAAGRLTIEQAEKIGPAALDGVTRSPKPAGFVAEAFGRHLDNWLERITVVAPEDDLLPLPSLAQPQVSVPKSIKPRHSGTGMASEPNSDASAKPPLPACVVCDARADEEYPKARTVTGDDGREHPCPKCAELGLCPAA